MKYMIRKNLDRLYLTAGFLSALCILTICVLVTLQVIFNLITKIFGTDFAFSIPSYADFAGFLLATATILALAYTLQHNGHIRVTLVRQRLSANIARNLERCVLCICACISAFLTYAVTSHFSDLVHFGDVSSGIVPIPLWIPQLAMAVGLALLTLALIDNFIQSYYPKTNATE